MPDECECEECGYSSKVIRYQCPACGSASYANDYFGDPDADYDFDHEPGDDDYPEAMS